MKTILTCLLASFLSMLNANAQAFKFAFVSDTHIGGPTAAEDLRRTVKDINNNSELKFVVITGDITEFGADDELKLAKQILDSLNKKWYVIPGNHDSNWSESGSNSFRKIFGSETSAFNYSGYLFAGTSSGPNMRMGPGQVPRENIVWLDSLLNKTPITTPIIYLNHYPQDSSQNNWYNVIDLLKKENIQLILCGHGHSNHKLSFEGIPGIMGRSNLRAKDSIGAYNIVTIDNGKAIFEDRQPVIETQTKWAEVELKNHFFNKDTTRYFRPSYKMNGKLSNVQVLWTYQDQSDIGSGMAASGKAVIITNTKGYIYALNKINGKKLWTYKTNGKIYATPVIAANYVVVGSTDGYIYCLSASSGKVLWKVKTVKAIVASALIKGDTVYIGASDGHFRAINIGSGKLIWHFANVSGFVVDKPLIYGNLIYFGCWNNDFYALDLHTGKMVWQWNNGSTNRMFSPAACYPVAANNRIFIVAPDRFMTALNAKDGAVIWRKQMAGLRVRESMGLSADSSLVYVKTMDGQLAGISTRADSMQVAWKSPLQLPYELDPSNIVESTGKIYVPTQSGVVYAVNHGDGTVAWQYKISNSLVNPILPDGQFVFASTMDGKVICFKYYNK